MGGWEIALIIIIALIFFGPDKIPQIVKTIKKGIGFYADARNQVQEVVNTQIISPEELAALKDPLGMGGNKVTPQSLLTPERKSLYSQTTPAPPANTAPTAQAATQPVAFESAQVQSAGLEASQKSVIDSVSDAAKPVAVSVPAVQESQPTASKSSTAAESIWASLEQAAPSAAGTPSGEAKEA